jgi:hypothetical protein
MQKLKQTMSNLVLVKAVFLLAGFYLLLDREPLVAEIYSWVDENGVKHFSNTAPPQRDEKIKSVEATGETKTTAVEPTRNSGSNATMVTPITKSVQRTFSEKSSSKSNNYAVSEARIE